MNEKTVFHRRAAEIAGVSCLALALFLLLALFSYHPLDPSLRHYYGPGNVSTRNLTGSVGSYTADTLIWIMGLGIIWLPAMLLVVALRYFREPQFRVGAAIATGTIGLVFATSGLLGLLIGNIQIYGSPLDTGGLLGMFTARLLDAHLSLAGSLIVLFLIMTVALMILFDFSLVTFTGRVAEVGRALLKAGMARIAPRREEIGEKREAAATGPDGAVAAAPVIAETKREALKRHPFPRDCRRDPRYRLGRVVQRRCNPSTGRNCRRESRRCDRRPRKWPSPCGRARSRGGQGAFDPLRLYHHGRHGPICIRHHLCQQV